MERFQLAIARLLFVGVLVSLFLVLLGGFCYLWQNGPKLVHYQVFHSEPIVYKSIKDIFVYAFYFTPLGMIQLGLLVLVLTQILRVALTAWLFIRLRDRAFFLMSTFIFCVLIYSLI